VQFPIDSKASVITSRNLRRAKRDRQATRTTGSEKASEGVRNDERGMQQTDIAKQEQRGRFGSNEGVRNPT
jgi:hypothetical protein